MAPTERDGRSPLFKAVVLTILSQFMFNLVFVCLKYAKIVEAGAATASRGVGVFEFLFARSVVTLLFFASLARRERGRAPRHGNEKRWLLLRALLGAAALMLIAYGSMRVPIAVMNLFNSGSIFLVAPLAALLFRETFTGWKVTSTVAGFVGVVLVLYDGLTLSMERSVLEGYFAGVLFLLTAAAIRINLRKLEGIKPSIVMTWVGFVGIVVSVVALAARGVTLPGAKLTWLLVFGAVAFEMAAQYTATISGQIGQVMIVSLVGYSGLVFAVLSDVLLFHSRLTPVQVAGGVLVVLSAMVWPILSARRASRAAPVSKAAPQAT